MSNFTTWRSLVDGEEVSAIPDSAVHHMLIDEGSGTTIGDDIGSLDGSLGDTNAWISDETFEGGHALDFSNVGSGGSVSFGGLPDVIEADPSQPWGLAITISADDYINASSDNVNWVGGSDDGSDDFRLVVTGNDDGDDEFMMDAVARDIDDYNPQRIPKSDFDYTDPDQFRAFMVKEGAGQSDLSVYINGEEQNLENASHSNIGSLADFAEDDFRLGSRGGGGDTVDSGILDNLSIYENPTEDDIERDYEMQPWS